MRRRATPSPADLRQGSAEAENRAQPRRRARLARAGGGDQAFQQRSFAHPAFPEAWNELGYAFRNRGLSGHSTRTTRRSGSAQTEALNIWAGIAKMGRLDDARRMLQRQISSTRPRRKNSPEKSRSPRRTSGCVTPACGVRRCLPGEQLRVGRPMLARSLRRIWFCRGARGQGEADREEHHGTVSGHVTFLRKRFSGPTARGAPSRAPPRPCDRSC
jgi:hypothetical protein